MSRFFETPKGTKLPLMDIKGKPYLSVQHRVMWFREVCPEHSIETEFVFVKENEAMAKAVIKDPHGRILAMAHKVEDRKGFADFVEKSESSAIGRALGFLGYGTQFALDLEEGERLADAPTNEHAIVANQNNLYPSKQEEAPFPESPYETNDIGNYVIEFGKYKTLTVEHVVRQDSPSRLLQYADWLEKEIPKKTEPLKSQFTNAMHAIRGYVESMEIPKDENLNDKLQRLKNEFESDVIPF